MKTGQLFPKFLQLDKVKSYLPYFENNSEHYEQFSMFLKKFIS